MGKLKKQVYMSDADYTTLVTEGTITKGEVTVTYSPTTDMYLTPLPDVPSVSVTAQDTDKIGSITVDGTTYQNIPFSGNISGWGKIGIGNSITIGIGVGQFLLGSYTKTNGDFSLALGPASHSVISSLVSTDGPTINRIFWLQDTSKLFFRNENVSDSKTTFAQYTSGWSLEEMLHGLTKTDNTITELDYNFIVKQTLSNNVTYTLRAAPTSTGTNLSCIPTYKAILTTTAANITVTMPVGTICKTDDTNNCTIVDNVITLISSAKKYHLEVFDGTCFVKVW